VLINAASGAKDVEFAGFNSSWNPEMAAYLTSDAPGDDLRMIEEVSLADTLSIPGMSVLTLVASKSDTEPPFEGYDPNLYQLYQNYPNPFNTKTNLSFNLPQSGSVELSIYSLRGEKVHSVEWQNMTEGVKHYSWDGLANDQTMSSSGVYLYTLRAGNSLQSKKMLLLQ